MHKWTIIRHITAGLISLLMISCTAYNPYPDLQESYAQSEWLRNYGVQMTVIGDQTRIILQTDHFFEIKSSEFRPSCRPILAYIWTMLRDCPTSPIAITAHTDDIGNYEDNLILSQHQAFAIASYFWSMGIGWDRFIITGHADHMQIASDDRPIGNLMNRRIEIRMMN